MPASISRFVPGWTSMQVDLRVLAVTTLIALAAAVLFGIVPALQCTRPRLADTLKEGSRGATAGRARQRIRRALVVAEITLALPLLVASAMGAIGAHRFLYGYQGYDPERVLAMEMVRGRRPTRGTTPGAISSSACSSALPRCRGRVGGDEHHTGTRQQQFSNAGDRRPAERRSRVSTERGLPQRHAGGLRRPWHPRASRPRLHHGGREERAAGCRDQPVARQAPLAQRRPARTTAEARHRAMAHDRRPLRRHVHDWFNRRDYPTAYVPFAQSPTGNFGLAVRAAGDPAALSSAARAAVRAVDANQPVYDVMTLRDALRERTLGLQYIAAVMGVLGALALVLAAGGVYGVMAYMVAQRARDWRQDRARRDEADVVKLTVSHTVRLAASGVALGITLSLLLGR